MKYFFKAQNFKSQNKTSKVEESMHFLLGTKDHGVLDDMEWPLENLMNGRSRAAKNVVYPYEISTVDRQMYLIFQSAYPIKVIASETSNRLAITKIDPNLVI